MIERQEEQIKEINEQLILNFSYKEENNNNNSKKNNSPTKSNTNDKEESKTKILQSSNN